MWKPQRNAISNKLLQQSSDSKKIAKHKVNLQKRKVCIYTSNKYMQFEMKASII